MTKLRPAQAAITAGTRVVYFREFLRNTGQFGIEAATRNGIVREVVDMGHGCPLALVAWTDLPADETRGAMVSNLWPASRLHLEPA
jgi:hypothetical protein